MILFADSGSTKTSWLLYDPQDASRREFKTLGINPVVQNHQEIDSIVQAGGDLLRYRDSIHVIRFYGAGCSSAERIAIVSGVLRQNFPNAEVHVDHDMIAAGIAVCGGQPGIACILGTGSNSILFDGKNWHNSRAGIGYILGDEGSGAYLGKYLLRDFIYGILPAEIAKVLADEHGLTKDIILENVYKRPSPNRYLASFSPVLSTFRETEYVQQLLHFSFSEFFRYGVSPFPGFRDHPVGFVGSIARYFDRELIRVAGEYGCRTGKFVQRPIDDIADYFIGRG